MEKTCVILVIDDDEGLRRITSRVLREAGCTMYEATNGEEGLRLAGELHPDLVITDVVLPGLDGVEVCRRVKSDPGLAGTFCILLSGIRTSSDQQVKALDSGADGYITRPIPPLELVARVQALLRLKKAEEEQIHNLDIQKTLNELLLLSLEDLDIDELLQRSIDLILAVPWLSFQSRGCIFLAGKKPGTLEMRTHRGLSAQILRECACIPYGKCLCGRAAADRKILFKEDVDEQHEIRYGGMIPHGHYCIPILHANQVLGVINLYLRERHLRDQQEEKFLSAVAATLAGILVRKRMEEVLKRNAEQLRDFLTIAAHELRHPITIIGGYAKTLTRFLDELPPETVRQILAALDQSSERLVGISDELLDVSRIGRGTLNVRLQPCELGPLLEEVLQQLRARYSDCEFALHLQADLGTVRADPGKIERVMVILLENAAIFSPAHSLAEVMVERGEIEVMISVLDRGIGVPEEAREYIFERFYQVEEVMHHSTPGLGFGLYIARQIVEAHAGRIWHEPREGGGSIFHITLPLA